ncbi:MAG TPA: hypothetical protein VM553_12880 [Dongiaceae bacterium]|nr:hypothetical protein [Dongiaceae bacterium]
MRAVLLMMVWLGSWMLPSMLRAEVIEISFSGEIFAVDDASGDYWQGGAADLVGLPVQGRYLLDTELAGPGRGEAGFFWWWNIDNDRGALMSEISFGDHRFNLTSDHDCHGTGIDYMCNPEEYIYVTNDYQQGDDIGEPVEGAIKEDDLTLKDEETVRDLAGAQGEAWDSEELTLSVRGPDFMDPPFEGLDPEWRWSSGAGSSGGGTLRLSAGHFGDGVVYDWDTAIRFNLKEVVSRPAGSAVDVPEPAGFGLLLLGWLTALWLRHRTSDAATTLNVTA